MGGGEGLVINSVDQFLREWPPAAGSDVLALSQPLDLPDGTVIVAAYGNSLRKWHEFTAIHLPKPELIECLARNSLTGSPLLIVHGLDAWLRFFSGTNRSLLDNPALRCTRLLAYLLDPPEKVEDESDAELTLEALVRRYLQVPYFTWGVWLQGEYYPKALYKRLWEDARLTFQLWHKLMDEIDAEQDKEFLALYHDVELPMVRILVDMELQGVRVDEAGATQRLIQVRHELIQLQQQITQLVGSWVNPNRPQQVRPFLSWLLQQPYAGKINDEAFENLVPRHPALIFMLRYRKLSRDWKGTPSLPSMPHRNRAYFLYRSCSSKCPTGDPRAVRSGRGGTIVG
jgi:DNA polymerase I-like protein with 3'-5' exonuclease and polymerase domains